MLSSLLTTSKPYYQNSVGHVAYHPTGYVQLAWLPIRGSLADIQQLYERTLQLLANAGSNKLISDHAQRPPLPPEAQNWLHNDWMPRVLRLHATQYCAIVEGHNPLHRLATQAVVSQAPAGFRFGRFASLPEAQQWLEQLR